jgi:hypothetical protein
MHLVRGSMKSTVNVGTRTVFVCTSRILFKVQNCVIGNGQLVTKWANP